MAIKSADLVLGRTLLLIGEQASGKSTVAKLLYFFKRVRHIMRNLIYDHAEYFTNGHRPSGAMLRQDFENKVRNRFQVFFGSRNLRSDTDINYCYGPERSIRFRSGSEEELQLELSDLLADGLFGSNLERIISELGNTRQEIQERRYNQPRGSLHALSTEVDALVESGFGPRQNSLYIPALRGIEISLPEQARLRVFGLLSENIRELETGRLPPSSGVADWYLIRDYVDVATGLRDWYREHSFTDLVEARDRRSLGEQRNMVLANQLVERILRGRYEHEPDGEKIYFSGNDAVELSSASSGQQNSVRILQDIFLRLTEQDSAFRVIEEPEAHLYPMAQKHLLELIALMVNHTDSQVVITTHSPYVLSVFNNLLYATRVAEINPSAHDEIAETIPEACWLNPDHFYAYALKDGMCQSIIDHETGLIDQNFLDEISEELGDEFNILYSLHAESMRA